MIRRRWLLVLALAMLTVSQQGFGAPRIWAYRTGFILQDASCPQAGYILVHCPCDPPGIYLMSTKIDLGLHVGDHVTVKGLVVQGGCQPETLDVTKVTKEPALPPCPCQ